MPVGKIAITCDITGKCGEFDNANGPLFRYISLPKVAAYQKLYDKLSLAFHILKLVVLYYFTISSSSTIFAVHHALP